ncbi:MAG TPA: valine--tRNA ligase [Aquifex aeolicus]|uniref:Valine--tRNA ligase n=1 Tax=Aquifex aeolicus TaxID=63363 RepID=A0A9D0YP62_AQUAO|nr:valine--tRNA ligase [Aquifex aeolicus]
MPENRENLPKHYNPEEIEKKWREYWLIEKLYHVENPRKEKKFSMVQPPPNVTGSLHLGHAWNITIQDIVARYKRMEGYDVVWVPGFDHAGIATQYVVEKQLKQEGKTRFDLGREGMLKKIWEWVPISRNSIKTQLQFLGGSVDWERERFTMDEGFSRAVREVFHRLYEDGLIYRGRYIVNWCPKDLTALSDLEVEHEEEKGKLWYIRYPVVDESGQETGEYLTVATTRPETLLGDTAVAVHPEDPRYKHLVGKKLKLPLVEWKRYDLEGKEVDNLIPVIADKAVKMDFGTGAVKVTPAHDPNDFEIGKRHNLPMVAVMDETAHMNKNAGEFQGLERFEARQKVVEKLKELRLLEKEEEIVHSVGHCYRCKTVVEPMVSLQWFVKTSDDRIRKPATEVVEKEVIRFVPDFWKKHYLHWMDNLRDWCISRQIWWGHRIPVWYCQKCGSENVYSERSFRDYLEKLIFNMYANQKIGQIFSSDEVISYLKSPNFVHPELSNAQFYEKFVFLQPLEFLKDEKLLRELVDKTFVRIPLLKRIGKEIVGFVPHAVYMLYYNNLVGEEFSAEELYRAYKEKGDLLTYVYEKVLNGIKRQEVFESVKTLKEWLEAHTTAGGCKNNRIFFQKVSDRYAAIPDLVEEVKYLVPLKCRKCGSSHLRWEEDVLDTWFSSALWPFGVFGFPEVSVETERKG